MQFSYYDLGNLDGGDIVQIALSGNAANVRLMDGSNFSSFRAGRQHRFYGGNATRSPVRLQVPHSGRWYVTVDLGGYGGAVRSNVQVLPGRLRPLTETPLAEVPTLVNRNPIPPDSPTEAADYDVFISHASEDKEVVVRPLAHALQKAGLHVWYDEFELKIGDSLRRKIDLGLAGSRFGIVVLSRSFFSKGWTNYELNGLVTRAVSGDQILLPIWHNVSKQEVMSFSPSLADKVARNTTMHTVDEIASEIAGLINDS